MKFPRREQSFEHFKTAYCIQKTEKRSFKFIKWLTENETKKNITFLKCMFKTVEIKNKLKCERNVSI